MLLLVGKKKSQNTEQNGDNSFSSPSSPPFYLRPLSPASWSVSLRLPLGSPATLRGGPGSPVRYNYRIQALARYRREGGGGGAGNDEGGGPPPSPSSLLAAAAVAVRVLPPRHPASAASAVASSARPQGNSMAS